MDTEKLNTSPKSNDSNSSSNGPNIYNNSDGGNEITKSIEATNKSIDEKQINLNDFLDFLKISCHVNDMITNSVQSKAGGTSGTATAVVGSGVATKNTSKTNINVDLDKLAENRLVNELLGHDRDNNSSKKLQLDLEQQEHDDGDFRSTADKMRCKRRSGSSTRTTPMARNKSETKQSTGLHPKLTEKLNHVINEGVMDSILPYICPVQLPSNITTKLGVVRNKKDLGTAITKTELTLDTIATAVTAGGDNETDSCGGGGMVKLRDPTKFNQARRKSRLGSRSGNSSTEKRKEAEVVIHVCDEVKNTSRDFFCPQNLLVSKMGYFADVTAGQKLEDMDISVHCDIQIFDWLMRWVKHSGSGSTEHTSTSSAAAAAAALEAGPQLDACNVVPILVSASFLQMEPLLVDCLSFCHARLSEVVRTSTNLSCLNDSIVTRLAAMFTNVELEMIRDKKERVTPRLWTKLIQSLCEPEPEALRGHYYSLAGLFRCSKCGKCLTNTIKSYINCLPSNIRINRWGQLESCHVRDSTWDMNTFITHLFRELKSWRRVYWKLWGHCHFLYCCICEMHFPVFQMTWCRYHPEPAQFLGPVTEGRIAGPAGRYACCGQQAFRYETLPGPNGCQFREHSVLVETDRERSILSIAQLVAEGYALCESPPAKLQDLISSGDVEPRWQGLSLTPQRCRTGLLPVLNPEETSARMPRLRAGATFTNSSSDSDTSDTIDESRCKKYMGGGASCRGYSTSSDGCESDCNLPKMIYNKKGRKKQTEIPGRYWSGDLSARSNQDHQRQFEEKVMKQVIAIVNKKTGSEHNVPANAAPMGGSYVRLEAEWKDQIKQRNSTISSINCASNTSINKQRNK